MAGDLHNFQRATVGYQIALDMQVTVYTDLLYSFNIYTGLSLAYCVRHPTLRNRHLRDPPMYGFNFGLITHSRYRLMNRVDTRGYGGPARLPHPLPKVLTKEEGSVTA